MTSQCGSGAALDFRFLSMRLKDFIQLSYVYICIYYFLNSYVNVNLAHIYLYICIGTIVFVSLGKENASPRYCWSLLSNKFCVAWRGVFTTDCLQHWTITRVWLVCNRKGRKHRLTNAVFWGAVWWSPIIRYMFYSMIQEWQFNGQTSRREVHEALFTWRDSTV